MNLKKVLFVNVMVIFIIYVNGCMIIYNIFLPIKAALRDRVEVTALSPHTKRRVKIILRSTFCMWRHHSE